MMNNFMQFRLSLPSLVRPKASLILAGFALTMLGVFLSQTAHAQQDQFERSLETFDQRAVQVQVVVESSRNPQANTLYENAVRTRDQAEATYRQGNIPAAQSLLDRALALLVQAENLARGGNAGDAEMRRLRNLLVSLRQNLQDSKRWLHELEVNNRPNDSPSAARSFLVEQKDRTESIIDRANQECTNTNSDRCRDLLDRAQLLFQQADQIIPAALEPVLAPSPMVENRLRDARQFLDKAQTELDQIQRELTDSERLNSATVSRIRNVENLIRYGNDRLQDADVQTDNLQQGQSTLVLTLLRRANELAQLAIRANVGSDFLQDDFLDRNNRVDAIRQQVESLTEQDANTLPQYNQGIDLQNQAIAQADAGNYEIGIQLLSQASTAFNNALAQANTAIGGVNANDVYNDLKGKFENDYQALVSATPNDTAVRQECVQKIELARGQADQAEQAYGAGNLPLALDLLNQAQQSLSGAKACLGQSSPRIVDVLNRLQTQFDKRLSPMEDVREEPDPATEVYLKEAKNLRQLSDAQESSGNYEQAVQTIGQAIKNLGTMKRLAGNRSSQSDLELLSSIQQKYDSRIARVRELSESRGETQSLELLDQADRLRRDSEEASNAGNYRLGLTQMGQAISLLERAALGS